ncbi:MAG: hypothetical protein LBC29_00535 [Propionibacteriaceae bacterium]|nr:hypothetical protein [Propionibacteriaceae bacterium]
MGNATERFELREPLPLRSLPGTAVVLAVGIYLVINRSWEDAPTSRIIGFTLITLGVIFPLIIGVRLLLNVVHITLTPESITARGPKLNGSMRWDEVTNWAIDPKGSGIVLMAGEQKLKIISPNGRGDDEVFALGEIIENYISTAREHLGGRVASVARNTGRVYVDPDSDFGFDD